LKQTEYDWRLRESFRQHLGTSSMELLMLLTTLHALKSPTIGWLMHSS